MAIAAFVPLAFFIVIAGSVGFRLVALWRRTRQLPELCLGAGLLLVAFSMPLTAIGRVPATAMEPLGRACFAAGLGLVAVGISAIVLFTFWVFRRDSAWGRALCVGLCGLLLAAVVCMSAANFRGESVAAIKRAMRPGTLTVMVVILFAFVWGWAESFRCYFALRRRLALGMGEPVVANRFLLWGIAALSCSILVLVLIACVLAGMTIVRAPAPMATIAVAGTLMSATWYLTFFAPEAYLRLVRERARARWATTA